jgi:hypothetical protein
VLDLALDLKCSELTTEDSRSRANVARQALRDYIGAGHLSAAELRLKIAAEIASKKTPREPRSK